MWKIEQFVKDAVDKKLEDLLPVEWSTRAKITEVKVDEEEMIVRVETSIYFPWPKEEKK